MVISSNPAFATLPSAIIAMNETQVFALSAEESRALATIVAIYFLYGVWKLSHRVNGFDELRRAVALGNWTWVDGLSANLELVAGLSRAHLQRLLRSVRQEPAIDVPRVDLSFDLTLPVLLNPTSRYLTLNYTSKRPVTIHAILISSSLKPIDIASLINTLHENTQNMNNINDYFLPPPFPTHRGSVVEGEEGKLTASSVLSEGTPSGGGAAECVSGGAGTQQVFLRLPTTMFRILSTDSATGVSEPSPLVSVPAPTNTATATTAAATGSKTKVMLLIVCIPSDDLNSSTTSLLKRTSSTPALSSPPPPAQASRFALTTAASNPQPKHLDDWVMPYKSGTLYKVGELFGIGYEEQDYDDGSGAGKGDGNGDNFDEMTNGSAKNVLFEEEEEEEEEAPCIVCFTDERDVIFLPCRHRAVCSDCFSHMDTCPVCRSSVKEVVKVVAVDT